MYFKWQILFWLFSIVCKQPNIHKNHTHDKNFLAVLLNAKKELFDSNRFHIASHFFRFLLDHFELNIGGQIDGMQQATWNSNTIVISLCRYILPSIDWVVLSIRLWH